MGLATDLFVYARAKKILPHLVPKKGVKKKSIAEPQHGLSFGWVPEYLKYICALYKKTNAERGKWAGGLSKNYERLYLVKIKLKPQRLSVILQSLSPYTTNQTKLKQIGAERHFILVQEHK